MMNQWKCHCGAVNSGERCGSCGLTKAQSADLLYTEQMIKIKEQKEEKDRENREKRREYDEKMREYNLARAAVPIGEKSSPPPGWRCCSPLWRR